MQLTGTTVDSPSLSGATIRDLEVVVDAFIHTISAAAGTKLEGIVGHNFLNQFLLSIDYPQNRLTLVVSRKV
jgi:hypothetical protein